jgi:tetratricopeptide (TPR) repeat protein
LDITTPADPLIGRTIAQYEVVARIGGGGMGVVYKAIDTKLGRAVALKFLPPQWSHDEGAQQRFLREAQAASATNHRNICIIHDIGHTSDGQLFIVMAYYEGQTLKEKLEAGALPLTEALDIATEVAEGLAKAHAQGVVHRDVKPGNLMITDDGVKVLDFGLAKFADSLQLTMPGSTVGTVAYMSPEQARGEDADVRSDVWALGVVLYEMLAGRVPFAGAYAEAIFHAIKNEPVPPLNRADREVPLAVQTLVARALEKDPERRYQSARELARDLRMLQGRTVPLDLRTEQLPPLPPLRAAAPRSWATRARRAMTPARSAVAALAIIAVAAAMYAWIARPIVRIAIAIAPVANHTGEPDLDTYRLALTQSLIDELAGSPNLRVVPYSRLLEVVRRFIGAGGTAGTGGAGDVSSSEAIEAIASQSGARFVVLPSLEYRSGMWFGAVQVRSADTGTTIKSYETPGSSSALPRNTALALVPLIADAVQAHFKTAGPGRAYTVRPASSRFRNLEAAQAYEQGANAYEQLEYSAALDGFQRAAALDDQHAMTYAWLGRVALLVYRSNEAVDASRRAKQLIAPEAQAADLAFVDAVLAETLKDFGAAEAGYRQLAALASDDPAPRAELARFLRRRDRNDQAVEAIHEVLRVDPGYAFAHVELCQLYTQLDAHPLAEREAQTVLTTFRSAGNRAGEAQALLCLSDAQREQAGQRLPEARRNAAAARAIFEAIGQPYNLSRACFYQGLVEYADLDAGAAIRFFQEAASRSRTVGNRLTEGVALMNVAASYYDVGHQPAPAIDYYRQSHDVFEQIGEERRAAEQDVNAASLQVDYGSGQGDALRRLPRARAVLEKLGYIDWAVMAMQVEARGQRYGGYLAEARRQFVAALSLATERQLSDRVDSLAVDLAATDLLRDDYEAARKGLVELVARDSGRKNVEARIVLGRVLGRLGDFNGARQSLNDAMAAIESRRMTELLPEAATALGEVAYDEGRSAEARAQFERAAAAWTDDFPPAASVEARSYVGLLDGLAGDVPAAIAAVEKSVAQADKMGRLDLEAASRVRLARLQFVERRFADAVVALKDIPTDGDRRVGPALGAQVHDWRARALAAQQDAAGAARERGLARKIVQELLASQPTAFRDRFAARPEIKRLLMEHGS